MGEAGADAVGADSIQCPGTGATAGGGVGEAGADEHALEGAAESGGGGGAKP